MEKPFEGYAEIMLMYVHPKFQHQGFGSRLLMHTLGEMRKKDHSDAVLDTAEKNPTRGDFMKDSALLSEQAT